MLTRELMEELRQILREDYGCDLPLEEAAQIASSFVSYFELLTSDEVDGSNGQPSGENDLK